MPTKLTNALREMPTPEPNIDIRARVMARIETEEMTAARRVEWRIERRPGVIIERRIGTPTHPPAFPSGGGFVERTQTQVRAGRTHYQAHYTRTQGETR